MDTPALFLSTYPDWVENPHDAFAGWLSNRDMKLTSKQVYLWMWGKFVRWMSDRSLRLDYVDAAHLDAFLVETDQNKHNGYVYLRLIERVYSYINALADAPPNRSNPASRSIQTKPTKLMNRATVFLDKNDRVRCARVVENGESDESDEKAETDSPEQKVLAGKKGNTQFQLTELSRYAVTETESTGGEGKPSRLSGEAGKWKRQRDLALAGIFIGGGLRVQEACLLTISCILDGGNRLRVQHTTGRSTSADIHRVVPLEPFAAIALRRWLTVREGTHGDAVFPSNKKGKAMDASTMFRRIQLLFAELGLHVGDARACCQTLRNSYIATLFDYGLDHLEIATRAGLSDIVNVVRIEKSYMESLCDELALSHFESDLD